MRWLRGLTDLDDERGMVRLRRFTAFVLVLGLVSCAGEAGSGPADPTLLGPDQSQGPVDTTTTTTDLDGREDAIPAPAATEVPATAVPSASGRTPLPGFGEVAVDVTAPDGSLLSWCLLLAETEAQSQRGLMEVTDPQLGGYDGMLFRFQDDHDAGGFYMRNTPQELSIAYLDAAGGLVSTTVMEPCADEPGCPSYAAAGPYRATIEVPTAAGGVAHLGIVPGAVVTDTRARCAT